jgi:hypothetical protein
MNYGAQFMLPGVREWPAPADGNWAPVLRWLQCVHPLATAAYLTGRDAIWLTVTDVGAEHATLVPFRVGERRVRLVPTLGSRGSDPIDLSGADTVLANETIRTFGRELIKEYPQITSLMGMYPSDERGAVDTSSPAVCAFVRGTAEPEPGLRCGTLPVFFDRSMHRSDDGRTAACHTNICFPALPAKLTLGRLQLCKEPRIMSTLGCFALRGEQLVALTWSPALQYGPFTIRATGMRIVNDQFCRVESVHLDTAHITAHIPGQHAHMKWPKYGYVVIDDRSIVDSVAAIGTEFDWRYLTAPLGENVFGKKPPEWTTEFTGNVVAADNADVFAGCEPSVSAETVTAVGAEVPVFKFASHTRLTEGRLVAVHAFPSTYDLRHGHPHRRLIVRPADHWDVFAEREDLGAVVFTRGGDALGMITDVLAGGHAVVTPMYEICAMLGVTLLGSRHPLSTVNAVMMDVSQ